MGDMQERVARVKRYVVAHGAPVGISSSANNAEVVLASDFDAILALFAEERERLEREREAFRQSMERSDRAAKESQRVCDQAEAREAALVVALRPFVAMAEVQEMHNPGGHPYYDSYELLFASHNDHRATLTMGDFRALRAALALGQAKGEEPNAESAGGWVSVKDGLPAKPGDYEVCWEHFVPKPVYEPMPLGWDGDAWDRQLHPTHWRPLPEPPKEMP